MEAAMFLDSIDRNGILDLDPLEEKHLPTLSLGWKIDENWMTFLWVLSTEAGNPVGLDFDLLSVMPSARTDSQFVSWQMQTVFGLVLVQICQLSFLICQQEKVAH